MPTKKEVTTKKTTSPKATKAEVKDVAKDTKKVTVEAVTKSAKTGGLSVAAYSLLGKTSGTLDLPKEVFGAKVNQSLLSQAVKIYLNNQKAHWSNTQTRGEVTASTKKIFKQKGTGRARHGSISAPIFVGGGIALGPKSRKVTLDLPKKMRLQAMISALSDKATQSEVLGLSDVDKATGKTKEFAKLFKALQKKSALIITDTKKDLAQRAAKNLSGISVTTADQLSLLDVLRYQSLVLTREAADKLVERLTQKSGPKEEKK